MNRGTCKFYTGDHHNTHCAAGVCYRDVTTEPDRLTGSAFRKPCIDWEEFNRQHGKQGFDNQLQAEEWAKRGHCDKREEPTDQEIADWQAKMDRHTAEVIASLEKGVVPPDVMVCGPGTFGVCKCNCPDGPCEHVWDGEIVEEDGMTTVTCSRCGKWAVNHDMWM
jgi:hypothetical protein